MKHVLYFTLLFTFSFALNAQEKKLTWDYPVKPDMEEWKSLDHNQGKINACQIPEKILSSLTTIELTDICLRYPLIYDIFAFNDWNIGIDNLFNTFNGIRELYKRTDVSKELLKRYQIKMQKLTLLVETGSAPNEEFFNLSICALEWLLARYSQMNEVTIDNCKEVLQNLLIGFETENLYENKRGGLYLPTNFFSRACVIKKMISGNLERIPEGNRNSVFTGQLSDIETAEMINELSYELIK
jgi:hypothetical protein